MASIPPCPPVRIPIVAGGAGLTRAMAAAMVAAYDPVLEPAPIVIGVPKLSDPAHGWVDRLTMQGDAVVADWHATSPAFASSVLAGTHRMASASFYGADSPYNPSPGSHYLKHVTFSGPPVPLPSLSGANVLAPVTFAPSALRVAVLPAATPADDGKDVYQRALALQAGDPRMSITTAARAVQAETAPIGYRIADTDDLYRRAKLIQLRNPGHPWMAAYRAAQEEAEAVALAAASPGNANALLNRLAKQLQAANLDLSYSEAIKRAGVSIAADRANHSMI